MENFVVLLTLKTDLNGIYGVSYLLVYIKY